MNTYFIDNIVMAVEGIVLILLSFFAIIFIILLTYCFIKLILSCKN